MSEETTMQRWRGLAALVHTAVEQGSRAIERVHLDTAKRPFAILEQVPAVAGPSKLVHVVHDAIVSTTYTGIRLVNGAVGKAAEAVIDQIDQIDAPAEPRRAEHDHGRSVGAQTPLGVQPAPANDDVPRP